MEDYEVDLYSRDLRTSQSYNERLGFGIAAFQALSNIAVNGVALVVLSYGGLLLANNQISPGNLMSFLIATQTIQRSLGSLSTLFGQVVKGLSSGSRVFQYITVDRETSLQTGGLALGAVGGTVYFKDVLFSYPSRPNQVVLDNLTLTLPQGKVTALCGLSGAGKSTVAALLERFYEPTGGRIYLDDSPLDELDPSWLRGRVLGFINQEPVLFATTIMENIRYGRPSASDREVFIMTTTMCIMKPLMSGPKASVGI
ncbi:Mitochondrial potassium channel ATP-binding subunit [Geodia barretti]|uniref:Mitochondrial potassium channel ATP-binding subunit n=1 Tax=Geodia barretti TaxID=519541 RepID=A0AA35S6V7_GEOBA|nr:Mitochondrial potassium channel ATP-binding subunit [Geodia barretti]